MHIAVIGATGALGDAFISNLIQNASIEQIYAFSRAAYQSSSPKVSSHKIDIASEDSIRVAAQVINQNTPLDLLIVATGILHNESTFPERSLKEMSAESFNTLFQINTIGPALIAKYFLPLLATKKRSVAAFLSARVGSISDNRLGGWYAYRASKAALNMVIKNLSIEIARKHSYPLIIGLHPGTVESKLSAPFQANVKPESLFTPDYAASKLLNVIKEVNHQHSGSIIDYNAKLVEY